MKKRFAFFVAALLLSAPLAHAATADELRAQIASLLAQIESIRAQLGVSAQTTTATGLSTADITNTADFFYSNCPNLQYNLEPGDTDAETAQEVTLLQQFLSQDPTLYPEKIVSGYFGTLTEMAVRKFQVRHVIVQTGDYQSTGYGAVGPKTRAAIARACTNTATQTTGTTNTTTGYGTLTVSPSYGAAPLSVTVTLQNTTGSACTSYEIDWGDISVPLQYEASPYANCNTSAFSQTFTHTYAVPGSFTIRAKAGTGALSALPAQQKEIVVYGGTIATEDDACFVSPQSGTAPLAVSAKILLGGTLCDGRYAYYVDWGDGEVSTTNYCSDTNSHYEMLSHTYTTSGTRTARLLQSHPNARFAESTCRVNINTTTSTTISGSVTNAIPDSCKVWYDGCNTCSRSYRGGSLACTKMACFAAGQSYCREYFSGSTTNTVYDADTLTASITNASTRTVSFSAVTIDDGTCTNKALYTVYFGDGSDALLATNSACGAQTRTTSHTYATAGTYTVSLLRDGVAVDTITVTVSGTTSRARTNSLAAAYTSPSALAILRAIDHVESVLRMLFK